MLFYEEGHLPTPNFPHLLCFLWKVVVFIASFFYTLDGTLPIMSIFKGKARRERVMKLSRVYGQLRRAALVSVICPQEEKLWFLWFILEEDGWGQETGAEGHTNLAFEAFPVFSSKGSAHQGPILWGIMFWALKTRREDRPCTVQDFLGCTWQKVTHIHLSNKKHLLAHKIGKSRIQLVSLTVSLRCADGVTGPSLWSFLDTLGLSHKGCIAAFLLQSSKGILEPWSHRALLDITITTKQLHLFDALLFQMRRKEKKKAELLSLRIYCIVNRANLLFQAPKLLIPV